VKFVLQISLLSEAVYGLLHSYIHIYSLFYCGCFSLPFRTNQRSQEKRHVSSFCTIIYKPQLPVRISALLHEDDWVNLEAVARVVGVEDLNAHMHTVNDW